MSTSALVAALPIVLLVGAALLGAAALLRQPARIERRRARLRARPFPAEWRRILRRRVPLVARLPPELQLRLKRHIQVFLAEKPFIGCAGLDITDEVRVTIAAQACLLILNRKPDYFANLHQILVYPGAFIVERFQPVAGNPVLQSYATQTLTGESWTHGRVVISWEDALEGAAIPDDGRNVVIHEFAHQLDQQKGHANGAPWLGSRHRYPRWSQVLGEEYARLQQSIMTGEPSLFSAYAATSPAEFFAVISEVFFERPREMASLHPALYAELCSLYRIDPASW